MDLTDIREYCLSMPCTEEDTPFRAFDENVLTFKVGGKMFLLTDISDPSRINLKCDPGRALELRERHEEITPGVHMNKRHWNTVCVTGDLPRDMIREMIADSYRLVVATLPKSKREEILRSCLKVNQ